MTVVVRDARPPTAMVAVLNPILRVLLRTPVGRFIKPFALLEFAGRTSGRRYRIPVGWHELGERNMVFTPATWCVNFRAGAAANIHYRGHARVLEGALITDPMTVADSLNSLLQSGVSPKLLGLDVPQGHQLTVEDVQAVRRALIEFRPAP